MFLTGSTDVDPTALAVGSTVTLVFTLSEPVSITGGTPSLTMNDGGTAVFNAAVSSATTLTFVYTVQPGDMSAALAIRSFNLNGASITDGAGNPLMTALTSLPSYTGPVVDTSTPIISVSVAPQIGDLTIGQSITLTVNVNEAVSFVGTGTPYFTLNDGGRAIYDLALSTSTAEVFVYTVGAGENTSALNLSGFDLNGDTLVDAFGHVLNLAAVPSINGPMIDTAAPTLQTMTITAPSITVDAGQFVTFTITASEIVIVSGGTPSLTLNDGGIATYSPTLSTGTSLVFTYAVQSGQNASVLSATTLNLNGASIADLAGNLLNGAAALPAATGPLVDTTAPFIISITGTPSGGVITVGGIITLVLTLSEPVSLSGGIPTLTLNDGGVAIYDATHSTPTSLVFTTTVGNGQNVAALGVSGLNLNGATVSDPSGNGLNEALPTPGYSGPTIATTLPAAPTLLLADSTTPTVAGIAPAGDTVTISDGILTLGTTTAGGTGSFSFTLPASTPQGVDTLTATATDAAGNVSPTSLPLVIALGPVMDWNTATSGVFATSGRWLIDGVLTQATPNASNTAEFLTGSSTPYTVSGNGTVAKLVVTGDQVTTSGNLVTVGLTSSTTEATTDLAISGGGKLTLAGGSLTTAHAVTLGGTGSAATLAATDGAALNLAPGVTLASSGSLLLDNTAALQGPLILNGGTLAAIPAIGGTGAVENLNNAVSVTAGATDTAGSFGAATLGLLGTVTGAGALTVVGNLILDAANSFAGGVILDNGTLDVAAAGAQGTGTISSVAGTTNRIEVDVGTSTIASNGTDTIVLGTGNASITANGAMSLVGGSGNATVTAAGAAVTVTAGTGNLVIGGTANLVETAPDGGSITYTGSGHITYLGSGSGSETVMAAANSTITTGTGSNRVTLGSGSNTVTSTGSDTIQASSGADTISASGPSTSVIGGSGQLTFFGGNGTATVTGGIGSATLIGGAGGGVFTGGSAGHNVLEAGGGNTTLIGGGVSDVFYGSKSGTDVITAKGSNATIVGGGGSATITGGGDGVIYAGNGNNQLFAGNGDVLVGGAGPTEMVLATGNVAFGGAGNNTIYAARNANDILVGGAGTTTMVLAGGATAFGGTTGTSLIQAGAEGQDTIVAGQGNVVATLAGNDEAFGGTGSSTITGSAAGNDIVVGGSGNTTFVQGTGDETYFGSTGATTMYGSSGTSNILTGSGNMMLIAGSGTTNLDLEGGSTTVFGGTGYDAYLIGNGFAGGQTFISNFKLNTDQIFLANYGASPVTSIASSNGNTAISLTDGTSITLLGVTHLAPNSLIL